MRHLSTLLAFSRDCPTIALISPATFSAAPRCRFVPALDDLSRGDRHWIRVAAVFFLVITSFLYGYVTPSPYQQSCFSGRRGTRYAICWARMRLFDQRCDIMLIGNTVFQEMVHKLSASPHLTSNFFCIVIPSFFPLFPYCVCFFLSLY